MKKDYNINDEWKSFYIEKLLDCHFCCYECDKQIIEYLIKWTDYRLKFNKWYEKDLLDSVVELMLEYEICQNSNLNCIIYFHKLLVMNKTEFSAVSNNLSFKKQCHKSKQTAWSTWLLIFIQYSCTEWSMWFFSCLNAAVYTHSFYFTYSTSIAHLLVSIFLDLNMLF